MKKIFVTRPIQPIGLDILRKEGYRVVVRKKKTVPSKKELQFAVREYDALLSLLTDHIDAGVLQAAGTQLKIISNFAVGYDNIDITAAQKKGIVVANTPCEEVSDAVADHTIALIFALERKIVAADAFMRKGGYRLWDPMIFVGEGITGKTVGLLGLGRIGKSVAQRLEEGFKTPILYHDVRRDEVFEKKFNAVYMEQQELLARADIVSLHLPLLPSTHHMINAKALRAMKKGALLINTSRGAIVEEHAVRLALEKGALGGFATDVYECEPLVACAVSDRRAMSKSETCVFTPHIASATATARNAMSRIAAQNIIDVFQGRPPKNAVPTP